MLICKQHSGLSSLLSIQTNVDVRICIHHLRCSIYYAVERVHHDLVICFSIKQHTQTRVTRFDTAEWVRAVFTVHSANGNRCNTHYHHYYYDWFCMKVVPHLLHTPNYYYTQHHYNIASRLRKIIQLNATRWHNDTHTHCMYSRALKLHSINCTLYHSY